MADIAAFPIPTEVLDPANYPELIGPAGPATEWQASATHLQARPVGGSTWDDVVALSEIQAIAGTQIAVEWSVSANAVAGAVTLTNSATALTLDGDCSLAVPSPGSEYREYTLYAIQDATGSRTMSAPSAWRWAGDARYANAPLSVTRLDIRSSAYGVDVTAYPLATSAAPPNVDYAAAWGLRRINPAYSGPIARVRRAADGYAFDVPATVDGALDMEYVENYLQGATGTIERLYGQISGVGDFVQASSGAQPTLLRNGLLDQPVASFDGVNDTMTLTSGSALDVYRAADTGWASALFAANTQTLQRYVFVATTPDPAKARLGLAIDYAAAGASYIASRRLDADAISAKYTGAVVSPGGLWTAQLAAMDYANAKASLYVDSNPIIDEAAAGTSGQTSNTGSSIIKLCESNSNYGNHNIAEIIIGNSAITQQDASELNDAHRRFWLPNPAIPFGVY